MTNEVKTAILEAMEKCSAAINGDYKDIAALFPEYLEEGIEVPDAFLDGLNCPRAFWNAYDTLEEGK